MTLKFNRVCAVRSSLHTFIIYLAYLSNSLLHKKNLATKAKLVQDMSAHTPSNLITTNIMQHTKML